MNDQTSPEVNAQEPVIAPPVLPPGLDIKIVTAEEANDADYIGIRTDFQTAGQGRPLTGTPVVDGPTGEQVHNAIFNKPTEHIVEIADKSFKLVRLTQKHSLFYISVIAPKIGTVVKTCVPILKIGAGLFSTLQYLAAGPRAKLLQIAKGADVTLLRDTFNDIGVKQISDGELETLIHSAVQDRSNDFLLTLFLVLGRPLGVHLTDNIEQTDIASVIMSVSEQITELAIAALVSSARKTAMTGVDETWVREQIELLDTVDCMEIVYKQYLIYKEDEKLRYFLDLIMAPMKKNTSTAMPTA